jgi:hypothetical protein
LAIAATNRAAVPASVINALPFSLGQDHFPVF